MGYSKSAATSWGKFQRLSWRERRLLAQALLLLPLCSLALWRSGFRRWQSALARLAPVDKPSSANHDETLLRRAQITARMVRAAAMHGFYHASCLPQSLVLWWLLRRQGIGSYLCIGARKNAARLDAHAWVEFAGVALNDSDDVRQRFTPFEYNIAPGKKFQ